MNGTNRAARLHEAVAAICPIDGVSVGNWDDRKTWRVDTAAAATKQQRAAVAAVVAAFDPDVPAMTDKTPIEKLVDKLIEKKVISAADKDSLIPSKG